MAYPSVTYTFTNGTTASATEVNQNFTDLINGLSDGTKDLSISALTVAGTASLNGAVNIGNATSDDIAVNGYITTALIPKADDSYDLGTAALAWQDGYFDGKVYTDSIKALTSAGVTITDDGDVACVTCADGGAVTVGATTTSTSHKIQGTSTSGTIVAIQNSSTSTDSDIRSPLQVIKGSTTATSGQYFIDFIINAGATGQGRIVGATGPSVASAAWSDASLKDDITTLNALENVLKLKPAKYRRKDTGQYHEGFIANEVEEVYPDDVIYDENGLRLLVGWNWIDARLVSCIQEISAKLDEANARLAALEAK
jgi:hypothetical protein